MAKPRSKYNFARQKTLTVRQTFSGRLPAFKRRAFEMRAAELSQELGYKVGFGILVEMLGDNDPKIERLYTVAKKELKQEQNQPPEA